MSDPRPGGPRKPRSYPGPLSKRLYQAYSSFQELPYLSKNDAKFIWLGFVFALSTSLLLGLYLQDIQVVADFDPLIHPVWYWNSIPIGVLVIVTYFIAHKQWHYYYGGEYSKDGLFLEKLRQASYLETNLDIILAASSGVLTASVLIPTYWFLVLAGYSIAVVARSYVTLRRAAYASKERLLCVKAKNHFRAAFSESFATIVDADTPGPAALDLAKLPFRHLPPAHLPPYGA